MNNPTVSVLMSVKNCSSTIQEAISSIVNQTFMPWEMFVVDDGSADSTPHVVHTFRDSRITLIEHRESKGVGFRINETIKLVSAKYIARMDGDDISHPCRFARQVDFLDSHPQIHLVASSILLMDEAGNPIGQRISPATHKEICAMPWARFPMPQPAWMGRTEWFRNNRYSENSPGMEDYDLLFRTYRSSQFACIQEPLLTYREVLTVQKSFRTRTNLRKTLLRHGSLADILKGIPLSLMMSALDWIAISTGLRHKLLHHRMT